MHARNAHNMLTLFIVALYAVRGIAIPHVFPIKAHVKGALEHLQVDTTTKFDASAVINTTLQRRQCEDAPGTTEGFICNDSWPTMSQMIARIRDTTNNRDGGASPERRVYFYSNLRPATDQERRTPVGGFLMPDRTVQFRWMEGWMKAQKIPSYQFNNAVRAKWFRVQEEYIRDRWRTMRTDQLRSGYVVDSREKALDTFIWCFLQAMAMAAQHPDAYFFTQRGKDWDPQSIWGRIEFWKLTTNSNVKRIWRVDPSPGTCNNAELLWERGKSDPRPRDWDCPVLE